MTHNTREGIVEDETNRIYVTTKEHPDGELLTGKEVSTWYHQQLQKAREEERERIIKLIDWRGKGFHSGSEVVTWIDKQLESLNQSELDQLNK